jgi:hypothetical protein
LKIGGIDVSEDGVRLQLKGTVFKFELLQILGGVIDAAAKTLAAVKTGGATLTVTPNIISGLFGALKGIKSVETLELKAWLLVSGGLLYALERLISDLKTTCNMLRRNLHRSDLLDKMKKMKMR